MILCLLQYSLSMFSRSVAVNQLLFERSKPVIITTARTHEDTFHVSFQMCVRACTSVRVPVCA